MVQLRLRISKRRSLPSAKEGQPNYIELKKETEDKILILGGSIGNLLETRISKCKDFFICAMRSKDDVFIEICIKR